MPYHFAGSLQVRIANVLFKEIDSTERLRLRISENDKNRNLIIIDSKHSDYYSKNHLCTLFYTGML